MSTARPRRTTPEAAAAALEAANAAARAAARGERGEGPAVAYLDFVSTVQALGGTVRRGEVMAWAPCPVHGRRDEPIDPDTALCLWFHKDGYTHMLCAHGCDPDTVFAAVDAVMCTATPSQAEFRALVTLLGGRVRNNEALAFVRCPTHDDPGRSLMVGIRDGGFLLVCPAGCSRSALITALTVAADAAEDAAQ